MEVEVKAAGSIANVSQLVIHMYVGICVYIVSQRPEERFQYFCCFCCCLIVAFVITIKVLNINARGQLAEKKSCTRVCPSGT